MPKVTDVRDPQRLEDAAPGAARPDRAARRDLAGKPYAEQVRALSPAHQPVMMRAAAGAKAGPEATAALARQGVAGSGGALPHLDRIQQAFGAHDVSGVQAHTGAQAAQAADAMGAQAYATGDTIAFAGAPDLFTAAHEAAHVVQQRAGVSVPGGVGAEGDRYEQHADAVAQRVVSGQSAQDLLDAQVGASDVGGAGGAVQMRNDGATAAPGTLTSAQVASAVRYNESRRHSAEIWAQIAAVVGASGASLGAELVEKIAAWQAAKGLDADGKVGNITLQWLSQSPGGAGLEANVKSDDILYVGLNPSSKHLEKKTLESKAGSAKVTSVVGATKQDTAKVGGQTVDLQTDEGLTAWLASIPNLSPERSALLEAFIKRAGASAMDEVAQLAQVLNEAETGQRLIKRVVLSGHSGGWSIWGDDNGSLSFDHLQDLGKIFPMAVGQVEDLMLSACNTGQSRKLDQYKAIFPNVKSIWAYVGYSPSAATGALEHIGGWVDVTRGDLDPEKLQGKREQIAGQSGKRDQNIAVWTKAPDGAESYETASPEAQQDFATLKATVDSGLAHFYAAYDQGKIVKPELDTLYTQLQALTGNFGHRLGGELAKYELAMKRTLYLRYWPTLTKHFMATHGPALEAAYKRVDATMPRFDALTRDAALAQIAAYPGAADDPAYTLLVGILRDLDPAAVPDNWV